tara:strand:- start:7 stop:324 length:318 start_codon:yes stop_codon:yes gene_type:complete
MSKKYLLFSSFFTTLFYCFFLQVSIANDVVQFVPLEYCTENQNKKTDKNYDCCKFNCLTVEVEETFFKNFDFTLNNILGFEFNLGLKKEEYSLVIEQKNNSPPSV